MKEGGRVQQQVGAGGQEKWRCEGNRGRSKEMEDQNTDHLPKALRNWYSVYFGCWVGES